MGIYAAILNSISINGVINFHDTLTVTTGGYSNLMITAETGAINIYSAIPCYGSKLTPIANRTVIPETQTESGIYKLEIWRPTDSIPIISVKQGNESTNIPEGVFFLNAHKPNSKPFYSCSNGNSMGTYSLILIHMHCRNYTAD